VHQVKTRLGKHMSALGENPLLEALLAELDKGLHKAKEGNSASKAAKQGGD